MAMDLWSTWTHNQCGLYEPGRSMHSLHRCYLLASHVMWQLPPPLPSVSCFSWESSSGWPKSQARMAFDMHSSHNLIASFSKQSHELRLDVWPQLRLFRACVSARLLIKELKSYIPRLITTIPSNSNHLSFGSPSSFPSLPKQEVWAVIRSAKRGHSPQQQKKKPTPSQISSRRSHGSWLSDDGQAKLTVWDVRIGGALMKACCRSRISSDRQWRARGAGRGTSVLVGKRDHWLAWKKHTYTQKNTHKHTHECSQDKELSELPVAHPSTHEVLEFLSRNNIVPHHKENIIPGL